MSVVCFVSFKLHTPMLIKVQGLTATASHGDLPKISSQNPTVCAHEVSLILNSPNGIFKLLLCFYYYVYPLSQKNMFWEAALKRLLILDFELVLYRGMVGIGRDPEGSSPTLKQTAHMGFEPTAWCYLYLALHENREEMPPFCFEVSFPLNSTWNTTETRRHTGYYSLTLTAYRTNHLQAVHFKTFNSVL